MDIASPKENLMLYFKCFIFLNFINEYVVSRTRCLNKATTLIKVVDLNKH